MNSYILASTHIYIVFESGISATVYKNQPIFKDVCFAVKRKDWPTAFALTHPSIELEKELKASTLYITQKVTVQCGVVFLDDQPIHGTLVDRMLKMFEEGYDIRPMGLFLEKLYENPSHRAVNELYDFMEKSNLPITENGNFIAYKRVSEDFKDLHTGNVDNFPGRIVMISRNKVDDNRTNTCSNGLHFCSFGYLPHYGNTTKNKVVMVEISPRDVVSIPQDYNNAKGRCCQYQVICEIKMDQGKTLPDRELENISTIHTSSTTSAYQETGAVYQIDKDTNQILTYHTSAKAAGKATGINVTNIKRVCQGVVGRKTAGGFKWGWAVAKTPIEKDEPRLTEIGPDMDWQTEDGEGELDINWKEDITHLMKIFRHLEDDDQQNQQDDNKHPFTD